MEKKEGRKRSPTLKVKKQGREEGTKLQETDKRKEEYCTEMEKEKRERKKERFTLKRQRRWKRKKDNIVPGTLLIGCKEEGRKMGSISLCNSWFYHISRQTKPHQMFPKLTMTESI